MGPKSSIELMKSAKFHDFMKYFSVIVGLRNILTVQPTALNGLSEVL